MPEEADADVVEGRKWRGRRVREELKRHRGRVVRNADPVGAEGGEVGEAEEGLELGVGADLEGDGGGGPVGGDSRVKGGEDLGGEGGAGDGADGVRGVVGQVEFVVVGEGADLEEGFGGEAVGGGYCGVVDFGDVEVIEDWSGRGLIVSLAKREGGETMRLPGRRIILEYAFRKLARLALKVVLMVGKMLV